MLTYDDTIESLKLIGEELDKHCLWDASKKLYNVLATIKKLAEYEGDMECLSICPKATVQAKVATIR